MSKIKLDLNHPIFQQDFLNLEKVEIVALQKTLRKISNLTWIELHKDNGLKWEAINVKHDRVKDRIYTFRFSQKYRATAIREDNTIRILTLHVDHDSAY
ncbi:MAG TPA: hypothetical protein VGV92_06565 [Gammaproteobacteria bacterium]|nr:hypothetical protein [Gammaproteobacteria bacterium]